MENEKCKNEMKHRLKDLIDVYFDEPTKCADFVYDNILSDDIPVLKDMLETADTCRKQDTKIGKEEDLGEHITYKFKDKNETQEELWKLKDMFDTDSFYEKDPNEKSKEEVTESDSVMNGAWDLKDVFGAEDNIHESHLESQSPFKTISETIHKGTTNKCDYMDLPPMSTKRELIRDILNGHRFDGLDEKDMKIILDYLNKNEDNYSVRMVNDSMIVDFY